MYNIWIVWFVFAIILMIIEIFTPSFLFGLFSVAAFFSAIFAYFYAEHIYIQLLIFALISFILLIFIRKLIIRIFFNKNNDKDKTNMQAIIGNIYTVEQTIDNNKQKGALIINGVFWRAESANNTVIAKGEKVKIINIRGTRLIVEKYEE